MNKCQVLSKQVYSGVMTAKVKERFGPIIKRSFNLLISDAINERLRRCQIIPPNLLPFYRSFAGYKIS
jgi:hypothetical protein